MTCLTPRPACDHHAASAELRAVRALIMDDDVARLVDSDQHGATAEEPVTVSPPASTAGRARGSRVNRSRERLQHELTSLRQQAIALEDQLAMVTQGVARVRPRDHPVLVQAWRTVAMDQQQQKQQAERERDQLRIAIKDLTRLLKRVRRIVRERILRNDQFQAFASSRLGVLHAMDVTTAYREISQQLGLMHAQTSAVFQFPEKKTNHVPDGMFIYHRDTFDLPFDAGLSAEAVWLSRLGRGTRNSIGFEEERLLSAEHVVRDAFSFKFNLPVYSGQFYGLAETRRFVDGDHHFVLQSSLTSRATRSDGSALTGFEFCNCNWTVVYPVATKHANARPRSRIEVFEFTVPTRRARLLGHDALLESQAFSRASDPYVQTVERQVLENTLLDLARRVASREKS